MSDYKNQAENKKRVITIADVAREIAVANEKIDSLKARLDLIIAKREEKLTEIDIMLDSGDREL